MYLKTSRDTHTKNMEKGDKHTTLREQEQRGEQLLYEIAIKLSNKGKIISKSIALKQVFVGYI